ncbi:MAG TPA: hemerythrin domain-containing protein [Candidatus Polarisedimenticolaceae bacterium]|nr:hemerythrin domain-containing protein [Candidatus Polarisedimenticolaceae bacterium]
MDDRPERGSQPPRLEQTLDDHRAAMQVVAGVEDCLDRHPDRDGEWIETLRSELRRLIETLRAHFSAEEDGPLYRALPVSHPRFATRLRTLEAEHGRILDRAAQAVIRADRLSEPRLYEIRELNADLQLLVATIRRHEAEENEIVLSAHWDEVGIGD